MQSCLLTAAAPLSRKAVCLGRGSTSQLLPCAGGVRGLYTPVCPGLWMGSILPCMGLGGGELAVPSQAYCSLASWHHLGAPANRTVLRGVLVRKQSQHGLRVVSLLPSHPEAGVVIRHPWEDHWVGGPPKPCWVRTGVLGGLGQGACSLPASASPSGPLLAKRMNGATVQGRSRSGSLARPGPSPGVSCKRLWGTRPAGGQLKAHGVKAVQVGLLGPCAGTVSEQV